MDKTAIQIETRLDAPDLAAGHPLYRVVESALQARAVFLSTDHAEVFWPAEHFRLDRATVFRTASEEEQQEILRRCGQSLLAESYYIEKSGMYFAAKMCLLAETTQERLLYSLFNADEATHFSWINQFVSDPAVAEHRHNPFIQLLDEMLRREDRTTLTYLVQIVLEGWGIEHYRRLASACLNETLRQVFTAMLKDEARHHGSGLILFRGHRPSARQLNDIGDNLSHFFRMIQAGPQMVVSIVEGVKGHLSTAQKARLFAELDGERQAAEKILTLRSLLQAADYAGTISARLERQGLYKPFSAPACAAL
jgi:tRNA isopentenyl-2-thiomethyl-A-37 hydroxylase MiaE